MQISNRRIERILRSEFGGRITVAASRHSTPDNNQVVVRGFSEIAAISERMNIPFQQGIIYSDCGTISCHCRRPISTINYIIVDRNQLVEFAAILVSLAA